MSPRQPKKSLGQNFLSDPNTARKIVSCLDPAATDRALEIGPGQGALTRVLLGFFHLVMALEKDRNLCRDLKRVYPDLAVLNADALGFVWEVVDRIPGMKIVGNLPYNVASPIIWEAVSRMRLFERMVFMLQKEVAQRICAGPGSRTYGALSAWVQNFVCTEYLFRVGPDVFYPRPRVESAVVRFYPLKQGKFIDRAKLAASIKMVFSRRRKQLGNILRDYRGEGFSAWLEGHGLHSGSRPEEVPPQAFPGLARIIFTK
ncbi:MAG: 16S rRNA (adenine(1518)-N(6)/adenine(1519)-N(6))-dimethyltransferase RsmA [Desulfonatronovibrionaceae bacterium]